MGIDFKKYSAFTVSSSRSGTVCEVRTHLTGLMRAGSFPLSHGICAESGTRVFWDRWAVPPFRHFVPSERLELSATFQRRWFLRPVCLPIPPQGHFWAKDQSWTGVSPIPTVCNCRYTTLAFVVLTGFEPMTFWMSTKRSNQLSYKTIWWMW